MRAVFPVVLAFVSLASGCNGQGNYAMYRVAYTQSVSTDDCFLGGQDIDDAEDTSSLVFGETFAIFGAPDGVFYFDAGTLGLEGEKASGGYTFTGALVDVEYFGPEDASKTVHTTTLTVAIDGTGDRVTGTFDTDNVQDCSGPDCAAEQDNTCSTSQTFAGTRLTEADSLETTVPE